MVDRNALIVVDVQQGFDDPSWGRGNNPSCLANVERLLEAWRRHGQPVVLVRHDSQSPTSPLRPGQPGNALSPAVDGPHDLLVAKTVNSAFYGTPSLDDWLRASSITRVTVCGITTNHCCETTARMAGNLGYETTFVLDATRTFDRVGARWRGGLGRGAGPGDRRQPARRVRDGRQHGRRDRRAGRLEHHPCPVRFTSAYYL